QAKKERERAAGRLAAKRALSRLTGFDPERFEIVRSEREEDRGKPEVLLDGARALDLFISISHTRGLAAAVAAREEIGVDLERVEHREPSFEDLIATPIEKASFEKLTGTDRDRAVTLLWCTKEALGKRLGVGLSRAFAELDGLAIADRRLFMHDGKEHALVLS